MPGRVPLHGWSCGKPHINTESVTGRIKFEQAVGGMAGSAHRAGTGSNEDIETIGFIKRQGPLVGFAGLTDDLPRASPVYESPCA